jgi:glutathione synthase/RimK-type ligase-like ATP-grasp enzyme
MLLPGADYDVAWLRDRVDVVVNLISDVDRSKQALLQAAELVHGLHKPLINAPAKVLLTDRECVSQLLASTPNCYVPLTRRYQGEALLEMGVDLSFPLVVRVAGTHGGDEMERFSNRQAFAAFLRTRPATDFYVSDYVDYRSPDGLFRKYRFIFVGGEILPYHLGIDDKWKVHHISTDMANQPWMQAEEHKFLEHPQAVFGPSAYATLRAIQTIIGLDYFGIDCALDSKGRVVVFEVNASMLVHLRNEAFPYKTVPVLRIKSAFATMLQNKVA